eukprot:XP_002261472.1 SICA antigen [Plasmodium knowlesi strain H]
MAAAGGSGSGGSLEAWLQKLSQDGAFNGSSTGEDITATLRRNLQDEFDKLGKWMLVQESTEIGNFCMKVNGWNGSTWEGQYMQVLCNAIAEIKYFISGVRTERWKHGWSTDKQAEITTLSPAQAYARCIVGAVALSEIYGDHCNMKEAIEKVEGALEIMLIDHLKSRGLQNQLNNCKGVDVNALLIGKALLQGKIKEWTQEERDKGLKSGNWRVGRQWDERWPKVCMRGRRSGKEQMEAAKKDAKEGNREHIVNFSGLNNDNTQNKNTGFTISDVLINDDLTLKQDKLDSIFSNLTLKEDGKVDINSLTKKIKDASDEKLTQECMKENSKPFCDRLKCAEEYWKLNNGGQQGNSKDFWMENVKEKLEKLITKATVDNGGTTDTYCKEDSLDSANKEACKHMAALLNEMYQKSNSGTNKYSDQMISCLLLREYAKKLNEQAKQKGYCDIDSGLMEAFGKSSEIMKNAPDQCKDSNGTNSCFECNWDDKTKDDLDQCTIPNGQSVNEKVQDKVVELFSENTQTQDDGIQKTLAQFNTNNTFCERVKCALNWYENNGGKPEVWKKAQEEVVQPLGQAMSTNTDNKLDTHCSKLDNKNKEMCLLFARGLDHMYKETNTSGNDPMNLFKRTMMCAALNAYAKKLKDEAKNKASCSIEEGINKAFTESKSIMERAAPTCKDPKGAECFVCKEESSDKCEINTNGSAGSTSTENVNSRLKKMFEDDDSTGLKESLDKICLPCLDKADLCERADCVSERWLKNKKGNHVQTLTTSDWDDLWKKDDGVGKELTELSGKMKEENKNSVDIHCNGLKSEEEKEVCKLIASGLKSIYEIKAGQGGGKSTRKELEDQLFKRTMQCVLLNAFADKLESLPCAEEKKVADAITKAFGESGSIKGTVSGCTEDGDKCFKCERFTNFKDCEIKENGNTSTGVNLKTKINPMFDVEKAEIKKIEEKALKDICKPCDNDEFCARLQCVAGKWEKRNKGTSNGNVTWDNMQNDFGELLSSLLKDMEDTAKQKDAATKYCNSNNWNDNDAHGVANKTACKMVAAGLTHISSIQHKYKISGSQKPEENGNPYDNQEFEQLVSCLMLKAVVQKMKEQSPICDIQPGIDAAFKMANEIKGKHCINKKPCIVCNLKDKYDECSLDSAKKDQVKPKLEALFDGKKTEVEGALMDITKTAGNSSSDLCLRLQCLAPRVQASNNAEKFWTKDGEVANLWTELSDAMKANNNNEDQCNTMDNDNREATNAEKTACKYLHAGLEQLYKKDPGAATSPSPLGDILKNNPSLRRTMGCFLLHSYAKHMKDNAKCLVESGIKKAFGSWEPRKKVICNNTEPCVPCYWNEDNYDKCQINTIGTDGNTAPTPVQENLKQVQPQIGKDATNTLTEINRMTTLCDFIRCAAPKWFKNNGTANGNSVTATKDWCDFWDGAVKEELKAMFQEILSRGTDKTRSNTNYATCQSFGDGNEDSVERKACNHITTGLRHINQVQGIKPNADDDKFFKQSMMCAALNLYADQIIKKSKDKCPIDEDRINKMFTTWNRFNNISSSTSCSNGVYGCFECQRNDKILEGCNLSVSNTLIKTPSPSPNGDCNDNATEVKTKMDGLLKDKTIKMQPTLDKINEMDSFCTQLQCAAKQYYAKNNTGGTGTDVSWEEINDVVKEELTKLIGHITNEDKWKDVAAQCGNVSSSSPDDTEGEKTAKQKACKLFASGLKHISNINESDDATKTLKQTMMCAALNLYADQLIKKAEKQCPLDNEKLKKAIDVTFGKSSDIMNGGTPCPAGSNSCFECTRQEKFDTCQIGSAKVKDEMEKLLLKEDQSTSNTPTMEQTLDKINSKDIFCTELQCAIKQHYNKTKKGKTGGMTTPNWSDINDEAKGVLEQLLKHITQPSHEKDVVDFCKDNAAWNKGHKERKTNKAACLLFASGLKHIYNQHSVSVKGPVNGPSFEQTMGCLFLKEYAKQLQTMAEEKKKGNSWVHPLCDIDEGIKHAFNESEKIMKSVLSECSSGPNGISCFQCKLTDNYDNCPIGNEDIGNKATELFKDDQKQTHMQQTLENTVCPILLTDLLTPFLPLAPVSIGLSAMAYYLWKYFGPLGKGGPRFRRSPAEIPGSSVQEQVLDHVEEVGSHEYRLVKERKPRSAPTRTKRSDRANRRTIIEIHFEVLDECQKGETQLAHNDFLELLVREFMGSELMEEEQVSKEEVLMEGVPLELVPIEEVPSLGSGLLV